MHGSKLPILLLLVVVITGAVASAAECRTELGAQCYTMIAATSQWQLFASGLTDIKRFEGKRVSALRADGSNMHSTELGAGGLTGALKPMSKRTTLYLAPSKENVTILHSEGRILTRDPRIWHDLPYRRSADGDSECVTGIKHFGGDFKFQGSSKVAGILVVHWQRGLENSGREDIYMAPSLDCIPLKTYRRRNNSWGVPTFLDTMEATEVRLGQPSSELFTLPPGYRMEKKNESSLLDKILNPNFNTVDKRFQDALNKERKNRP